MTFVERLAAARASGDLGSLIASVPYSTFLGFGIERVDGEIRGVMRYREHLVGNAALPALHGGALAGLLETTAIAKVLWDEEPLVLPRPVTLTFDNAGVLTSPTAPQTFGQVYPAGASAPLTLTLDFGSATQQAAGSFDVASLDQDGVAAARLNDVSIADDGLVTATFSDGSTQALGRRS